MIYFEHPVWHGIPALAPFPVQESGEEGVGREAWRASSILSSDEAGSTTDINDLQRKRYQMGSLFLQQLCWFLVVLAASWSACLGLD